jgi:hypothetical protein
MPARRTPPAPLWDRRAQERAVVETRALRSQGRGGHAWQQAFIDDQFARRDSLIGGGKHVGGALAVVGSGDQDFVARHIAFAFEPL